MNTSDDPSQVSEQLPLFEGQSSAPPSQPSPKPLLTPNSALNVALGAFEQYMVERGFTENTQQAFGLDMQLLAEYLGPGQSVGRIGTANLNAFLTWLRSGRGVPCSDKSLERRITTLKVFFGWLTETGVLSRDPSAPLIHSNVETGLPDILSREEIDQLLAATQRLRQGDGENKPDARPHLLATLLLHTGIKKSECVNIIINHIDLTDRTRPALWIRYRKPDRRHKERRILLPTWWPAILQEYREQYDPRQNLFPWTARNLEYVLSRVAETADLSRLSFEMLRWTCATRDYVAGMEPEQLRHKLGLSEISWYEVEPKLALLAQTFGPDKPHP
ncbi:MAG TPA: site-specific integrase [Chloroflexi bacterium]|nr:site-specific integrase [Chloroflexota bacterium]